MPAFPSKILPSSSLLCFPGFFCPEFYNSAVRNCFWAETWQQKSDLKPGMIPLPCWFSTPFSLGQVWGAEEQRGGRGQRGALGTGAGWLRLLSPCFSGSLFLQLKQGWFLHNVAGIFLCMCLQKTAESFLLKSNFTVWATYFLSGSPSFLFLLAFKREVQNNMFLSGSAETASQILVCASKILLWCWSWREILKW